MSHQPKKYSFLTSRFTRTTENECKRYLARIGKQCLYGSSNLISSSVPEGELVFVIEMRINPPGVKADKWLPEDNQISGIGMIHNKEVPPEYYCDVYENKLYNQFTYMGDERIDRAELLQMSPLLVELLDTILFKGKTHQKRNAYLSLLNDDYLKDHRNIVKTQVELAIQRGEIDPTHLDELLALDVKDTIVDVFKRKRAPIVNAKRKAEPLVAEPTIETTPANKHVRGNSDEEEFFDFFDGYDEAMLSSERDDESEYDFSDFVNLWTEESNLKADAKEEELYNAIYNGANILAATV